MGAPLSGSRDASRRVSWRQVPHRGLTVVGGDDPFGNNWDWGDLFPIIGLAKGLTTEGYSVRIASSPSYRDLVEGEEIAFVGIGPPLGFAEYAAEPKIMDGRMGGFAGFSYLFKRFIFPNLDRYVSDLREVLHGVDLLFAHPGLIAAPIAAETSGVRLGTVSVFPGLIPTALHKRTADTAFCSTWGRGSRRQQGVLGCGQVEHAPPVRSARQPGPSAGGSVAHFRLVLCTSLGRWWSLPGAFLPSRD